MKNTLFLSASFAVEVLENEENEENLIIIEVDAGSSSPQTLDVIGTYISTTVTITPGQKNTITFPAEWWSQSGDTVLTFKIGGVTVNTITISFPELLTSDAMLIETGEANHYAMKGEEAEDIQIYQTSVVPFENAQPLTVGPALVRVIQIYFTCGYSEMNGLFTGTINLEASGISDTATLTARIAKNNAMDDYFIPRQTIKNGRHVLTISYPVENIVQNAQNSVSVYLMIDSGQVTIDQKQAKAAIMATGITKTEWRWEGIFDISEPAPAWVSVLPTFSGAGENVVVDVVPILKFEITEAAASYSVQQPTFSPALDSVSIVKDSHVYELMTEGGEFQLTTEDGIPLVTEDEDGGGD